MTFQRDLLHQSVRGLSRLAGVLTLIALGIMVYSVLVPQVLPVMLAMSVGHLLGGAGFACFFVSVIIDAARRKPSSRDSNPPPSGPDSA